MNLASQFPLPLRTFVVDVPAGQFYNFHLPAGSSYPLKGVTYPVDYGHILGYTAEEGAELDLFVGNSVDGNAGSVIVDRGEIAPQERKFYAALTDDELESILKELKPVLLTHNHYKSVDELLAELEPYKDEV
jgi:hypothetical protein